MQGPQTRHYGRGEYGDPEAEVNQKVHYDSIHASALLNSQYRSVYPSPRKPGTMAIRPHDNLFMMKDSRLDSYTSSHRLEVLGALNGLGVEAVDLFPTDIEMQKAAIKNSIVPTKSIALDNKNYMEVEDQQGLSSQTNGKKWSMTNYDIKPSQYAQLDVPDPRKIENGEYISKPGDEADAIKLETKPYEPSSLGSVVLTHFMNQLKNSANYKKAMNIKYRSTHMWLNAGHATFNFINLSFVMGLYRMIKGGFMTINIPQFLGNGKPNPLDLGLPNNASVDTIILTLARAMGLIQSSSKIQGVAPLTNTKINNFSNFARDLHASVITDGSITNLLFGYNNATKTNPGTKNNEVISDTPYGQLITEQFNAFNKLTSGIADAYQTELDWVTGLVTDGNKKGRTISTIS